jgi:hypothetical protein
VIRGAVHTGGSHCRLTDVGATIGA